MELRPEQPVTAETNRLLADAAARHQAGDAAGAREKLQAASSTGEPSAIFFYASALASGYGGPADRPEAHRLLREIETRSASARRMLAVAVAAGWAEPADWESAVARRAEHGLAGDAVAAMEIALLCDNAGDAEEAARWALAGAAAGEGYSAAALIRIASAAGARLADADARLGDLRAMGHPLADDLASATPGAGAPAFQIEGRPEIERAVGAATSAIETALRPLFDDPPAQTARRALSPAACDYVAARYQPIATPSRVFDKASGRLVDHPVRRSRSAILDPVQLDLALMDVERRMAALGGRGVANAEPLTILFYGPGERYNPHIDYFEPDGGDADAELARAGQRDKTVLVVLRDRFEGGATRFTEAGVEWRGGQGEALVFDNLDADGRPNPRSRHAGMPVTAGAKALASLWLRQRPTRHASS
ncbi:MAG: 2OG-Fe(II) oxygenase [Pseudomonadota bacterium]